MTSTIQNVKFEGGQAILRNGMLPDVMEIVYFRVCPSHRNRGLAEAALRKLIEEMPDTKFVPIDILEAAEGFWENMATKGLVILEKSDE